MKTNKTDRKLMEELQKDGSISYSDLSAKVGITPKTVAKKVERLISEQIISVRAQPNPYKLGLSASALVAIKSNPNDVDSVCRRLSEFFHINLIQTSFGRFDILLIVYFPDWEMLHQFINDQLYTIEGVSEVELFFIKDVLKRYERFFKNESFVTGLPKIKDMDWQLIRELSKDGRKNPAELAKKLGVHVTTVYRRISALTEKNFITIRGVPNPLKLAYSANAYIMLDVDPSEVKNVCSALFDFPEIHFILTLSKRSGVIVCVHSTDTASLYGFLKTKIVPLEGILNTETFIGAEVKKTYYGWLIGIG